MKAPASRDRDCQIESRSASPILGGCGEIFPPPKTSLISLRRWCISNQHYHWRCRVAASRRSLAAVRPCQYLDYESALYEVGQMRRCCLAAQPLWPNLLSCFYPFQPSHPPSGRGARQFRRDLRPLANAHPAAARRMDRRRLDPMVQATTLPTGPAHWLPIIRQGKRFPGQSGQTAG